MGCGCWLFILQSQCWTWLVQTIIFALPKLPSKWRWVGHTRSWLWYSVGSSHFLVCFKFAGIWLCLTSWPLIWHALIMIAYRERAMTIMVVIVMSALSSSLKNMGFMFIIVWRMMTQRYRRLSPVLPQKMWMGFLMISSPNHWCSQVVSVRWIHPQHYFKEVMDNFLTQVSSEAKAFIWNRQCCAQLFTMFMTIIIGKNWIALPTPQPPSKTHP